MTNREAIERIKDHVRVHKIGEYPHVHLAEALNLAIAALQSPRPDWTPCAEGLPEDAKPEDLFRVFVQRTVKSGKVIREFTKEASFQYGRWLNINGFVIGNSGCDPYKETVVAYHRVPAFYRADQKEDTEQKTAEPKKESHNPQECRNCTVDHDHHKSYLVCEKKHGGIDRDPSVCDGCADFKRR